MMTGLLRLAFENPSVHRPKYATPDAACMDLHAFVTEKTRTGVYTDPSSLREEVDAIMIPPGGVRMIPTGIWSEIAPGYEIQLRPRGGLALKHQITLLNTPGTIDADYRGEWFAIVQNHGSQAYLVKNGDRIAQFALKRAEPFSYEECRVEDLNTTKRGDGAFASTGFGASIRSS